MRTDAIEMKSTEEEVTARVANGQRLAGRE